MNGDIEDGDVPPLSARLTYEDSHGRTVPWPTFSMQTAQDDLRVRASQREATRDLVTAERAKKAKRLQKRYNAKIERVELYAKHREELRRKVRDLNVKHSQQRSELREHIAKVRAQGSLVSGESERKCMTGIGEDALSMLRQSISSATGLRLSSSTPSISKLSQTPRASTTSTTSRASRASRVSRVSRVPRTSRSSRGPRARSSRGPQKRHGDPEGKQRGHVPDGSSFYEFDRSVGVPQTRSSHSSTNDTNDTNGTNGTNGTNRSTNISLDLDPLDAFQRGGGGGGSSLATSAFPSTFPASSGTKTTSAIDAETGETIELNLTSSMPVLPQGFHGMFSKSTGIVDGIMHDSGKWKHPVQHGIRQRQSWTSVPGTRTINVVVGNPNDNTSNSSISGRHGVGGSSLLAGEPGDSLMAPLSTQQEHHAKNHLRARTADPTTFNRSGFLRGKDARKMLAHRAKHVSLGQLAPRDMIFPQPTTFWEKEWAAHSGQHATQSSVHISDPLRKAGMKHVSDMRQRQMQDMQRLLEIEREKEIERQAKGLAMADSDPKRKKRLHALSTEDRQKSRARILRVAREHELALASRMASLGILR